MEVADQKRLEPSSWVTSFGDYLFSYALLKVGKREIAEDLVQEAFISAIKAKDTFKGDSSEKTWLTAILNNKIIDHYRKTFGFDTVHVWDLTVPEPGINVQRFTITEATRAVIEATRPLGKSYTRELNQSRLARCVLARMSPKNNRPSRCQSRASR